MFQKYFMAILCALMTFASISCFAKDTDLGCLISVVDGHKVYLKPGSVQIAKNGIFINVAGQLRAINHLEMDEQGVYFDIYRQAAHGDVCPACHITLVWGLCMNPACPSKG
ncbi:hypothetical protein [Candidatus Protochlamydia amoebophila]|uniref:Secreted protein n=1 Tax=Protochlamydia amoebophila (strain UWE25) TaxID=264201 RepID=Q6MB78_PARUW|nr:hypothetical protein [Candidatus Protochlamydia amoebophila]CAF24171.1 unnamed protein product [Candidatus Protochlamydia amoebophila UWE25]